jgi:hypothetical protein
MLPKDVTQPEFQLTVDNLSEADLIRFSVDANGQPIGEAPRYADGTIPRPEDVRAFAVWQYFSEGIYKVQMTSDYNPLAIARGRGGGAEPYLIKLDKKAVDEITKRPNVTDFSQDPMGIGAGPPTSGRPPPSLPPGVVPVPPSSGRQLPPLPPGVVPVPPGSTPGQQGALPRSTDMSGQARMADHEQSETIQNEKGEWVNVYGANLPKAGQQLPGTPTYDTMEEAVKAAIKRSEEHGKRRPKGKG